MLANSIGQHCLCDYLSLSSLISRSNALPMMSSRDNTEHLRCPLVLPQKCPVIRIAAFAVIVRDGSSFGIEERVQLGLLLYD